MCNYIQTGFVCYCIDKGRGYWKRQFPTVVSSTSNLFFESRQALTPFRSPPRLPLLSVLRVIAV